MAEAGEKICFERSAYFEANETKVFKKDQYEIKLKCRIPEFLAKRSEVGKKTVVECSVPEKYLKFDVHVYPGGKNSDSSGFVSIFLRNKSDRDLNYISQTFSIIKDNATVREEKYENPQLDQREVNGRGYNRFIKRSEIEDDPEKYLENGALLLTIHHSIEENIEVSPNIDKEPVGKGLKDLFLEHGLNGLPNTDARLICNDGEVKCHKIILACVSKVFQSYFKEENDTEENNKNTVAIKDANLESVQEMVEFIYTGEFKEEYENACRLIYLAQKYDIQGLKIKIEHFLCKKISVETAAELAGVGRTYFADKLEKMSCEFMMRNQKKVTKTEAWADLRKSHPEIIDKMFCNMHP